MDAIVRSFVHHRPAYLIVVLDNFDVEFILEFHHYIYNNNETLNVDEFFTLKRKENTRALLKTIAFVNQSTFEDHSAFLVALRFLGGEFVHPTEFDVTFLATDIADEMPTGEHQLDQCVGDRCETRTDLTRS